jgi:hypothetical protein
MITTAQGKAAEAEKAYEAIVERNP